MGKNLTLCKPRRSSVPGTVLVLILLIPLAGCSVYDPPPDTEPWWLPPTPASMPSPRRDRGIHLGDYVLEQGDRVAFEVALENGEKVPDLCSTFTVPPLGIVGYPQIGQLQLRARKLNIVVEEVRRRIDGVILERPGVSGTVLAYAPRRMHLSGEFVGAGMHDFKPLVQSSLRALIFRTGGFKPTADPRNLLVFRVSENRYFTVSWFDLVADRQRVFLKNGDQIKAAAMPPIRVDGAVGKPGSVPYSKDLTLLKLIESAGGLTKFARTVIWLYRKDRKGVERRYEIDLDQVKEEPSEKDIRVYPGDRVRVRESFL